MEAQSTFTPYSFAKSGDDGLQFTFADGNGEPKKLKLNVRKLSFAVELSHLHLPKDTEELLYWALEQRQKDIEGKYLMVCAWVKLKKGGPFWKKFNCRSLDELLARLDLPEGRTLGIWEILVNLFDKETFLLVGNECLGYMTMLLASYQRNHKRQSADYQAIFNAYCSKYNAFDKSTFYQIVHWYVNTKYLKPSGDKPHGDSAQPRDPYKRPPTAEQGRWRKKKKVDYRDEETGEDKAGIGIDMKACGGCKDRDKIIEAAKRHIIRLEEVIRINMGIQHVPQRPKILDVPVVQ